LHWGMGKNHLIRGNLERRGGQGEYMSKAPKDLPLRQSIPRLEMPWPLQSCHPHWSAKQTECDYNRCVNVDSFTFDITVLPYRPCGLSPFKSRRALKKS
jgi:hypothetical protein